MTAVIAAPTTPGTYDVAVAAVQAGLFPIPPKEDGTKAPDTEPLTFDSAADLYGSDWAEALWLSVGRLQSETIWTWKHWTQEPRPFERYRQWWNPDSLMRRTGIGLATGINGLECLEFDDEDSAALFFDTCEATGLHEVVDRVRAGYEDRTPGGGAHLLYFCEAVTGPLKLAQRPYVDELGRNRAKTLAETRGIGGYVIIGGSHGAVHPTGEPYRQVSGGVATIATITAEEREDLFAVARALDQMPVREPMAAPAEVGPAGEAAALRPGDDFNQRGSWDTILGTAGWTLVSSQGRKGLWRRPGKDRGLSATTNFADSNLLYVFTSSTDFIPSAEHGAYSKYRAYAILHHGGDFSAAARALREQGYGGDPPRVYLGTGAPLESQHTAPAGEAPQRPASDAQAASAAPEAENTEKTEYPNTDSGNGKRMADMFGADLRWCPPLGKFLRWRGHAWGQATDGEVMRLTLEVINAIDDDKWATKSQSLTHRNAMVTLLKSEVEVSEDELDQHPWLLPCLNGTLDLRTGQLRAASRADYLTNHVEVAYDPAATCPNWEAFLLQMTSDRDGSARPELAGYLQRMVGYMLSGSTQEQVLFILQGRGNNGKGVFTRVVEELLGPYAKSLQTSALMEKKFESIPNELADLRHARLVIAPETGGHQRFDQGHVKQLTGEDRIKARFLRQEFFSYRPQFKLLIPTNDPPSIPNADFAMWRRIRLIELHFQIAEDAKDKDLARRLLSELPGVLAWAVRGALAWLSQGLDEPESVRQAAAEYRVEMDTFGEWIAECCELDDEYETPAVDLYASYSAWATGNQMAPISRNLFGRQLTQRGIHQRSTKMTRFRSGIRLKPTQAAYDPPTF